MLLKITSICCILILLMSCSSDLERWNTAKANNDILSYEYYVEKHRNGDFVDSAKNLIENISRKKMSVAQPVREIITCPIALWDDKEIDKVSLSIAIRANQSKKIETDMNISAHNNLADMLKEIGISVIPNNNINQTELKLDIIAQAVSANYSGLGKLYTGRYVKGKISLTNNRNNSILLDIDDNDPCESNVSYTKQMKQNTIKRYKEPYNQLRRIYFDIYIMDFLYKVWGASPILWFEGKSYSDYPELKTGFDGDYSENFVLNVYQACYSENNTVRLRALGILSGKTFPFDSKLILPVVRYNIDKYGFESENKINAGLFALINKLGKDAIEITPALITYAGLMKKERWSDGLKERILESLNHIAGVNYGEDIEGLKEWWFTNKQIIVVK